MMIRMKRLPHGISLLICSHRKLTTVVVGSGALGLYYGSRLSTNNSDVHFIMRTDYERAKSHGVDVTSYDGTKLQLRKENWPTCRFHKSYESIPQIASGVDWILVSLKSPALAAKSTDKTEEYNTEIRDLIAPLLGPHTRILVLMNGLGCEKPFGQWFGHHRVFGGMAFVCVNRIRPAASAPLEIKHIAHGALQIGKGKDIDYCHNYSIPSCIFNMFRSCSL